MANSLIGTEPGQLPRNSDLGALAYMRPKDLKFGTYLLAYVSPTAVAAIDLLNIFTSDYDNYTIICDGLDIAVSQGELRLRFANGGIIDIGSNYVQPPATSQTYTGLGTVEPTSGKGISLRIDISNVNDSTRLKSIIANGITQNTIPTTNYGVVNVQQTYIGGSVSGLRLYFGGGQSFVATGSIRVYGFKNSW